MKKRYGQNFLINKKISQTIVDLEDIQNQNILEVGAGNLALTNLILQKKPKKFVSLEIDKNLIEKYKDNISKYILFTDAIKFNERKFFNNENFSIISNLPFNISSKLLLKWNLLQNNYSCIDSMTLMFQKELANRIISNENSKNYGRLSIITQAFFEVESKLYVSKNNFLPMPKVDAIVLKLTPHKIKKIKKENYKKLEKITLFFFNGRRKKNEKKIKKLFNESQILNHNLKLFFSKRPENICKEIYFKMTEID